MRSEIKVLSYISSGAVSMVYYQNGFFLQEKCPGFLFAHNWTHSYIKKYTNTFLPLLQNTTCIWPTIKCKGLLWILGTKSTIVIKRRMAITKYYWGTTDQWPVKNCAKTQKTKTKLKVLLCKYKICSTDKYCDLVMYLWTLKNTQKMWVFSNTFPVQ